MKVLEYIWYVYIFVGKKRREGTKRGTLSNQSLGKILPSPSSSLFHSERDKRSIMFAGACSVRAVKKDAGGEIAVLLEI